MGYESKLVIVRKSRLFADPDCNNKVWAEKIAEVNLCKCYNFYTRIKDYPKTNSYYYNGNDAILEDMYGDELIEIPIKDCIEILEECNKEYYRRFGIALGLLKAFNDNDWCDSDIVVLHYGY